MVDRSQPLVVMPQACPFVALDGDRDQRLGVPDAMHRCFAEAAPKARSMGHQASFCLRPEFIGCPIFLDWASRVAADVVEPVLPATSASAVAAAAAGPSASGGAASSGPASTAVTDASSPALDTPTDTVQRPWAAAPVWVAEAMPPPDAMDFPPRRPAGLDVDPGRNTGMGMPTDDTVVATQATSTQATVPTDPPPSTDTASGDDDSDTAAELAASMARSDLVVAADDQTGTDPRVTGAANDEGTNTPPWSRGGRIPRDAGAPTSLAPQTRPGARPSGPREWEGARRFEAYAARTGSPRPGRPVLIAIGAALVAVALLVVFLLPSLFRGGAAAPTLAPSSAASDTVATGRPGATPQRPDATPGGPEATPRSYRIKRGDTLSSIGRRFNVTVEQLMCANGIRDPNSLSVGNALIIPIESFQCPRPTKKPQKTPKG